GRELFGHAVRTRSVGAGERAVAAAGLCGDDGAVLFQHAQGRDLRGLERDPAQHHGEDGARALEARTRWRTRSLLSPERRAALVPASRRGWRAKAIASSSSALKATSCGRMRARSAIVP